MTLAAHSEALAGVLAALRGVPGVSAAEVEMDSAGGRLRLDLGPDADERTVAEQVDALLRSRFGMGLDGDHVQVVDGAGDSLADGPSAGDANSEPVTTGPGYTGRGRRPVIHRLQTERVGLSVRATVTLRHDGVDIVGCARGAATRQGTLRAVATATADAVQQLAGDAIHLDVEYVEVLRLGGTDRTVVVALGVASQAGSLHLTGAAAVRNAVRQAVVRATLDAVNRRLESMSPDQQLP